MKNIILKLAFLGILAPPAISFAQSQEKPTQQEKQTYEKPYNENTDAELDIQNLIKKAQKEHKNIILQAGGNWCIWCLRFNHFIKTNEELKTLIDNNFVYYHLNFSPKNKNEKIFKKYLTKDKQYGYPFFIILNKNGKKLHIQDSGVLEEGKGYDIEKVKDFLNTWKVKK